MVEQYGHAEDGQQEERRHQNCHRPRIHLIYMAAHVEIPLEEERREMKQVNGECRSGGEIHREVAEV